MEVNAQAAVDTSLISAARQKANNAALQSWRQGTEGEIQPVTKTVGTDGTIVLAQNTPRELEIKPNGELGITDRHTTITVIHPPSPPPVKAPQDTRIQTVVNGVDQIETRAILPEHLVVDQLDAVKKIADNGTRIAQQRFGLEQYKIQEELKLEYLNIVKSFVLWGFLMSIPFLLTGYWILQRILISITAMRQQPLNAQPKLARTESQSASILPGKEENDNETQHNTT
ncbi:hypothetical protein CSA56_13300 [candidate division KSB3 bacterium]|uniref:Uncharacterized protein n=1 Tax=candidate division KSB3 bacterium TaxID=2044937 RepID=A0A2G6KBL7_9BACT|nr:MAG: hypothetical protein CSA56_13300 [candidate division KSB3 bacterium]